MYVYQRLILTVVASDVSLRRHGVILQIRFRDRMRESFVGKIAWTGERIHDSRPSSRAKIIAEGH